MLSVIFDPKARYFAIFRDLTEGDDIFVKNTPGAEHTLHMRCREWIGLRIIIHCRSMFMLFIWSIGEKIHYSVSTLFPEYRKNQGFLHGGLGRAI